MTAGCLLPGYTLRENAIITDKKGNIVLDAAGKPIRDNVMSGPVDTPSTEKLEEIQKFLDLKGYQNVQLHIFELFSPKNSDEKK